MPDSETTLSSNCQHRRIRWKPFAISFFRSMFQEVMEKKIADSQERLTRLIKLIPGEVRQLVKPFIHDNPKYGYGNAMKLLERQYGNPFKLLAYYRN